MTTYPAVFGAFLSTKRKERGLSQAEIAETVGLTLSTWSRIENGETALTLEQLAQVALALSVTPGEMMTIVDTIVAELSKKGIATNIQRVTSDQIAEEGYIPLVGSGLVSTISPLGTFAARCVAAGAAGAGVAGLAAGLGAEGVGAAGIAAGAGIVGVAAGPLVFPIVVGTAAAFGLYNWLSGKNKKNR
jgi:transcriptional regulator with XRE-family HTH domain